LATLARDRNAPHKHVWRAEIVLLSADGVGTNEIMRRTGKSKTTVPTALTPDPSFPSVGTTTRRPASGSPKMLVLELEPIRLRTPPLGFASRFETNELPQRKTLTICSQLTSQTSLQGLPLCWLSGPWMMATKPAAEEHTRLFAVKPFPYHWESEVSGTNDRRFGSSPAETRTHH
jgi:hypothetical protein